MTASNIMCKISIITPCYNSASFIEKTIKSVQSQTLQEWEHIIVDDGSTDQSAKIIEHLAQGEPRLRLLRQSNGGVSKARNNGFSASAASSQFLVFLDADDCLEPTMLEMMSRYLNAHPEVGLLHCAYSYIDELDRPLTEAQSGLKASRGYVPTRFGIRLVNQEEETPFCSLFTSATIRPSMSMLRRSQFEIVGGFDEKFGHIYEETDVFLRIALHSKVHYLPKSLVRYRRHSTQATALGQTEVIERQEKKLYMKWENPLGLTPQQQDILCHADWFRHNRLGPLLGIQTAWQHLQKRQWRMAARFAIGALRRYVVPKFFVIAKRKLKMSNSAGK